METKSLQERADKLKNELAPRESHFRLIYTKKGKINKTAIQLFRFELESSDGVKLHGPHVTIILDDNGVLRGFARLTEDMSKPNSIGESEGKEIALRFIRKYAPDLSDIRFQWADDHSEKIVDGNGKTSKANALWVKFRDAKTGHYLWVMVAPDGSVMEFDRDIVWNFFRGGRVNELWLRDEWFGKRM